MTQQEIINAISALTEVVSANTGLNGNWQVRSEANEKIQKLMNMLIIK